MNPGALAALGFLAVVVLLLVHMVRHNAARARALDELMQGLGLERIPEPGVDLLPQQFFHPNGFGAEAACRRIEDVRSRVTSAWKGVLDGLPVTVMDVSIDRLHGDRPLGNDTRGHQFNRTVLTGRPRLHRPPDFLVREQVLLKGQVPDHVSLGGRPTIGDHLFVFSDATADELEPWLGPEVRERLAATRLWSIAAHDGTLFLTQGSAHLPAARAGEFLAEGTCLLRCMLRGDART